MLSSTVLLQAIDRSLESIEVKDLLSKLPEMYERCNAIDENDFYLNFKSSGVSLLFNNEQILVSIFLYLIPKDGFFTYRGWFGNGLTSQSTEKDVELSFGAPVSKGNEGVGMFNLYNPAWSKYKYRNAVLHYQYDKETKLIDMITIMPSDK